VDFELGIGATLERVEIDPQAFAAGELEGGDEIAVARCDDDDIDAMAERESSDVESDAQVHSLLFHVEGQVFAADRPRIGSPS
jgi:hypothetical protein